MALIAYTDVEEFLGITLSSAYQTSCTALIGMVERALTVELGGVPLEPKIVVGEKHRETHIEHTGDGPALIPKWRPIQIGEAATVDWAGTGLVAETDFYLEEWGIIFSGVILPVSTSAPAVITVGYTAGLDADGQAAVSGCVLAATARQVGWMIDGTYGVQSVGENGEQITPRKIARFGLGGAKISSLFDQTEWSTVQHLERRM